MTKRTYTRYAVFFAFLIAMLVLLLFWNINSDSVHLSAGKIGKILVGQTGDNTTYHIAWDIWFPRILTAVILGGILSASSFLLQTSFANSIAGPFMLGIFFGAKLVVSLLMISMLGRGMFVNSAAMTLAVFAGAMIPMSFVPLISGKVRKMSMLVIYGVMIGYICSTIAGFAVALADNADIVNLHNWFMGSFSGMSWGNTRATTGVVLLSLFLVFLMAKPISAYQLGEVCTQNMGINIPRSKVALTLMSNILSTCVTVSTDPISFVGITIPHLVRSLFKTARPTMVIPGCFLGGTIFCLFCNLIVRTIFTPTELSIGPVTAAFDAPVVVYMMVRDREGIQ